MKTAAAIPADQALDRLVRRHLGRQRAATHAGADEVPDDVVRNRAQDEADEHAEAVGIREQETSEPAQHTDVHVTQERDRGIHHGPRVHDLGEVPEEREPEDDHADEREGALAVVVRDPHHRERSEQSDQRGGLEPGAAEAVEELHRRGRDDDGDEHRSCRVADGECEERDRREDERGDDARGDVVGGRSRRCRELRGGVAAASGS